MLEEYSTLKKAEIIPTFTLFINVDDVNGLYEELKDKVYIAKKFTKLSMEKTNSLFLIIMVIY